MSKHVDIVGKKCIHCEEKGDTNIGCRKLRKNLMNELLQTQISNIILVLHINMTYKHIKSRNILHTFLHRERESST